MSFLGLDVGGTRCRCEWWPEGVHPGGDAAGVQPAVHGIEATVAGLHAVLNEARRSALPTAVVAALAGAGDARIAMAIAKGLQQLGHAFPVTIVGDVLAAAAAALADGPGVLLWSGTGSFAVARAENGELSRVGGRGYLLGDQGSGYDFVRRAAAAVLLAIDGLGPATALVDCLPAALGAPSPQRVGAVLQQMDPGTAARQLPLVIETAMHGDAVASEVLAAGVEALAMLANAAARSAGLELRGVPVSMGGGVLTGVPGIADAVRERLAALGVTRLRTVDDRAAARGAAWLAHGLHHRLEPQTSWVQRVAL